MRFIAIVFASLTLVMSSAVFAQDGPARPAENSATVGGSAVLPMPDAPFGGVIGRKADESKPDFPKDVTAPKGAPNVLLIMTDDTGFGATSTFGGPIPTPNFDRVAKAGLKYSHFHTTALCSPTRAARAFRTRTTTWPRPRCAGSPAAAGRRRWRSSPRARSPAWRSGARGKYSLLPGMSCSTLTRT